MTDYRMCCEDCWAHLTSLKPYGPKICRLWMDFCKIVVDQRERAVFEPVTARQAVCMDQLFVQFKDDKEEFRSILLPILEKLGYVLTTDIPGGMVLKVQGRAWDEESQRIVYCPRDQCVRKLNEGLNEKL